MSDTLRLHSYSCEYPEGCSCGAAEWNAMQGELAAVTAERDAAIIKYAGQADEAERHRNVAIAKLETARSEVRKLTAERDKLIEELRAAFDPDHAIAIVRDCNELRAERDKLREELRATLNATKDNRAFQVGQRVRKIKGSRWQGRVVGFYSTTLTPEGYAVESETETGSVQIYPAAALEKVS